MKTAAGAFRRKRITMEHYLDNSATTKVCPEAVQAACQAMMELYGNPSSTHTKGREAKKLLDQSRKTVSSALGCTPGELVFTSCGSESDNWALLSGAEAMKRKGKHVISSLVEHDAVRKSLDMLEAAVSLEDLRIPPANHLAALKGERAGQHSIRINDKYRVIFKLDNDGADVIDVSIVDYH